MPVTGTPAVKFGTVDPVEQGTRRIWTAEAGERQELVFRGIAVQLKALYDSLQTTAITNPLYETMEFDPGRGVGTLRVSYKGGEINPAPRPEYELWANEIQTAVENHEYFSGNSAPLSDDEILEVLVAYQNQYGYDSAWSAKQQTLYKLLIRGVHTVSVFQYVLRETRIGAKTSQMQASWASVGRVVSPPDTATVNALLGSIPACDWLKRPPQVRKHASRFWCVEQEYWGNPTAAGGGWSTVLYGGSRMP